VWQITKPAAFMEEIDSMKEVLVNLNETELVLLYDCVRKLIKTIEGPEEESPLAVDLRKILDKLENLMEAERVFAQNKIHDLKET
jgi:hypothetical protein